MIFFTLIWVGPRTGSLYSIHPGLRPIRPIISWPKSDNISLIVFPAFCYFIKSPTKTLSTGRRRNLNRTGMDDGPTAELAGEEPKVSYESHETPSVVIVGGGVVQQTPEDLVAKAIAPVKREFLLPPPIRPCSKDSNDVASDATKSAPSNLLKEKKSKRQLKRERLQVLPLSLSSPKYIFLYVFSKCL